MCIRGARMGETVLCIHIQPDLIARRSKWKHVTEFTQTTSALHMKIVMTVSLALVFIPCRKLS
jgi:hypothetical protein